MANSISTKSVGEGNFFEPRTDSGKIDNGGSKTEVKASGAITLEGSGEHGSFVDQFSRTDCPWPCPSTAVVFSN